ncbi:MAG TPA: YciI family protein [Pyrinomonadaceae bacterium]|jgi:hypothetical protein|nr:YciI family protein [Pyrinomonadaceae bacterium]
MVIVKATKDSEAGVLPAPELMNAMMKFNEEIAKAGVMKAGEGLQASSKGARVYYQGDKRTVVDGPFAETRELIAGFWLWECKDLNEAKEWAKKIPNPHNEDGHIEIRQLFEATDFSSEGHPELQDQEERVREIISSQEK